MSFDFPFGRFRVDRDRSGIPVAFPISGAKQNTQKKKIVRHLDFIAFFFQLKSFQS
jgi:hypothetical protein